MVILVEINGKIKGILEEQEETTVLRIPQGESSKYGKEDASFNKLIKNLVNKRKLSEAWEDSNSFLCYSSSYSPEGLLALFRGFSVKIQSIKADTLPDLKEAKARFGNWTHDDTVFYKEQGSRDLAIIIFVLSLFVIGLLSIIMLSIML